MRWGVLAPVTIGVVVIVACIVIISKVTRQEPRPVVDETRNTTRATTKGQPPARVGLSADDASFEAAYLRNAKSIRTHLDAMRSELERTRKLATAEELQQLDTAMAARERNPLRDDENQIDTCRRFSGYEQWALAVKLQLVINDPVFKRVAHSVWVRSPKGMRSGSDWLERDLGDEFLDKLRVGWILATPDERQAFADFFLKNQSVRSLTPKIRDALVSFAGQNALISSR